MVPTSLPELPTPSRTSGESSKPYFQNLKLFINIKNAQLLDILIWFGEFMLGNKTIWVVFDEKSDDLGSRMKFFHLDRVVNPS